MHYYEQTFIASRDSRSSLGFWRHSCNFRDASRTALARNTRFDQTFSARHRSTHNDVTVNFVVKARTRGTVVLFPRASSLYKILF